MKDVCVHLWEMLCIRRNSRRLTREWLTKLIRKICILLLSIVEYHVSNIDNIRWCIRGSSKYIRDVTFSLLVLGYVLPIERTFGDSIQCQGLLLWHFIRRNKSCTRHYLFKITHISRFIAYKFISIFTITNHWKHLNGWFHYSKHDMWNGKLCCICQSLPWSSYIWFYNLEISKGCKSLVLGQKPVFF